MQRSQIKRAIIDGSYLLVGNIGTVVIALLNLIILTRILSTEDMGKYSLFLMVANLAVHMGLSWSDASIIRHGREEYVEHGKINRTFWARAYLFLPILAFIILVYFVFNKRISEYIGIEPKNIVFVIGLFFLNGLLNSAICLYRSIDRMKWSSYILLTQKILYLAGLSLFFFNIIIVKLISVLIVINLSFFLTLIFNVSLFNFKLLSPFIFSRSHFRKIWFYSWPQLIGFSGLYVINYIDIFVIRKFLTISDVGVYNIAYSGFMIISGIILLINTVFLPLIVEYRAKKNFDMIRNYVNKIPKASIIWIFMVLFGVAFSKQFISFFFSDKYIPAIPSFNILLLSSVIYFIGVCFLPLMTAFDMVIAIQVFNLIKSAINIIGDFLLVPKYGIIGAAYGTMIAFGIDLFLVLILFYFKRGVFLGYEND